MTLPDCMMPDGAEPCVGYGELRDENERLRKSLHRAFDQRDAARAEIARLTERCEAYKGQVASGAVVIAGLKTEIERLWAAGDYALRAYDHLVELMPQHIRPTDVHLMVPVESSVSSIADARAALAQPSPKKPSQSGDGIAAINNAIRDVAELPDRNSPEDWPDAMLVTSDELRMILGRYFGPTQRDGILVANSAALSQAVPETASRNGDGSGDGIAAGRLTRWRSLGQAILDNDPNDDAADAATCLDVWRKEAADLLATNK